MPSYAEIRRSLEGVWRLARGDRGGMSLLDLSVDGFWRSFAAALLVAPAYALVVVDQYANLGWPDAPVWTAVAEALSYVCGWVAFPIAAIFLTRLLGLSARYVPLVVANNWSAVVQMALYATVVLSARCCHPSCARWPCSWRRLTVLTYQWFVIRTALGTSGGTALGLVVHRRAVEHGAQPRPRWAPAAGLGGWPRPACSAATRNNPWRSPSCPATPRSRAARTSRTMPDRSLALAHRLQRADDVPHLMVQKRARP